MRGLNLITDSVEKLRLYAESNQVAVQPILIPDLIKQPAIIPKQIQIANPRTKESRNFLGNIREILHMRFVEKIKPQQIGKCFHIRPEKINSLVKQFVIGIEDRFEK